VECSCLWKAVEELRREVGPPWAQDQKLAALAAWIALARSRQKLQADLRDCKT
jgi:hypothetical protein